MDSSPCSLWSVHTDLKSTGSFPFQGLHMVLYLLSEKFFLVPLYLAFRSCLICHIHKRPFLIFISALFRPSYTFSSWTYHYCDYTSIILSLPLRTKAHEKGALDYLCLFLAVYLAPNPVLLGTS